MRYGNIQKNSIKSVHLFRSHALSFLASLTKREHNNYRKKSKMTLMSLFSEILGKAVVHTLKNVFIANFCGHDLDQY